VATSFPPLASTIVCDVTRKGMAVEGELLLTD